MPTFNTKTVVIDNIITDTWYSIRSEIIDQTFEIHPFYAKMFEKGRIRERAPDGTHFEIPIRYAKADQNLKYFTKGSTFSKAEKQTRTRLIYETRNLADSIPRFWDDDRKNMGSKTKLIDYANEIVEASRLAIADKFGRDILVQNADPVAINALPTLIADDPTTGSIAGLTRSANTNLQNNFINFSGLTVGASLLNELTTMVHDCSKALLGAQNMPDILLMTQGVYEAIEEVARALHVLQVNDSPRANLGFGGLAFKGIEMFWDPNLAAGHLYVLNSSSLEIPYDPNVFMEMTDWKQDSDTLDRTAQIISVLNFVANHFKKNGVIFNIADDSGNLL